MRHWYYLTEARDRIAIPEADFYLLAGAGVIRPQTMVWTEGMGEWEAAGEIHPELFGDAAASAPSDVPTVLQMVRSLSAPLGRSAGMVKMLAVMLLMASVVLAGLVVVAAAVLAGELGERWWLVLGLLPVAGMPGLLAVPLMRVARASRKAYTRVDRGDFYVMSRALGRFFWWGWLVVGILVLGMLGVGVAGFLYRVEVMEFIRGGLGKL